MVLDADIDVMLTDCGDTFTAGEVTQPCLLTIHDEVQGVEGNFAGQVVALGFALVRTSAFPDLATDDLITVTASDASVSVDYRAAQLTRIQDGRMLQVFLGLAD